MKAPIILKGQPFPWHTTGDRGPVIEADGAVNWAAAAWADPGVMGCPKCKADLWNEGERVRCPDCGHEFETPHGKWMRERAAR